MTNVITPKARERLSPDDFRRPPSFILKEIQRSPIHLDRFSAGLDDLTRKQQADHVAVLRVLQRTGKFSCFEASENPVIARTMTRLMHKGCTTVKADGSKKAYGLLLKSTGGDYPWTTCALTDAGRELLADEAERVGERNA